jgi:trehalose-6-phosphatase
MKTNPLKEGALTENSVGIGTVTRKMVKERAIELAITDDRTAQEVSPADWQQAKQELSGRPDLDPKAAMLESAPESERWDPVPGSTGEKVPVAAGEDEDDEGRSDNEKLVDEGMAEAQLDHNLQAAKDALKKDL